MNYIDLLKQSSEKFSSIVCLGLDPVIEDIPETDGTPGERIYVFYEKILNKLAQKNIFPGPIISKTFFCIFIPVKGNEP